MLRYAVQFRVVSTDIKWPHCTPGKHFLNCHQPEEMSFGKTCPRILAVAPYSYLANWIIKQEMKFMRSDHFFSCPQQCISSLLTPQQAPFLNFLRYQRHSLWYPAAEDHPLQTLRCCALGYTLWFTCIEFSCTFLTVAAGYAHFSRFISLVN